MRKGPKPKPLKDRLLGMTVVDQLSGCWLFHGWRLPNGYGHIGAVGPERKTTLAHRAAWIAFKGDIPKGMCVLHTCDVRNCVNPEHLFLGTLKDNTADMLAKGRQFTGNHRGERNSQAKLTEAMVRELRTSNQSAYSLAKKWGVAPITAQQARRGHSWKHIT